jgi:hypothetical protein
MTVLDKKQLSQNAAPGATAGGRLAARFEQAVVVERDPDAWLN